MSKDLRSFLKDLEDNGDQIIRIKKEVDPKFEASSVIRKLQYEGKYNVAIFEKVKDSQFPMIANLFATRERLGLTLNSTIEDLPNEYDRKAAKRFPVKMLSTGPVQDVVLKGQDVDLYKLPICTHAEKDGGPYITPGVLVMKDPDTGIRNAGIYRIMQHDKNHLGVYFGPGQHGFIIHNKVETRDQPLEVAVFLGHHPATVLAAAARPPIDDDELELMGGLLGEPLEVVKCQTVDLEVPAYAEIVIEGVIQPHVRKMEGPFGEYTEYYGPARENPVIEVTAITYRKDAYYHYLHSCCEVVDHDTPDVLGCEAFVRSLVRMISPGAKVRLVERAGSHIGFVSMRKTVDGEAKMVGMLALTNYSALRLVVVVDDDVNIYNTDEVWWAIGTRTHPEKDFDIIKDCLVSQLDPSAYSVDGKLTDSGNRVLNAKVIIDATKPIAIPFPERCEPPETWKDINLEEYIKF